MDFDDSDTIRVRKGSYIKPKNPPLAVVKHFVFDLDETIGSFAELEVLWRGLRELSKMNKYSNTFQETPEFFRKILDLYPEFLRYGIITILQFLYCKKKQGKCGNVYLYTNNQIVNPWISYIIYYIETVGNIPDIFDQTICAFKIGESIIEEKRTTHSKTFGDLLRCTLLPKTAEVCFVDNTYFPKMKHNRVFYIQPKPYYHSLALAEIINRLVFSDIGRHIFQENAEFCQKWLWDWCISQRCSPEPIIKPRIERELDIQVSQKLMYYIKEFFLLSLRKPKTRKIRGKFWYNMSKKLRN